MKVACQLYPLVNKKILNNYLRKNPTKYQWQWKKIVLDYFCFYLFAIAIVEADILYTFYKRSQLADILHCLSKQDTFYKYQKGPCVSTTKPKMPLALTSLRLDNMLFNACVLGQVIFISDRNHRNLKMQKVCVASWL